MKWGISATADVQLQHEKNPVLYYCHLLGFFCWYCLFTIVTCWFGCRENFWKTKFL